MQRPIAHCAAICLLLGLADAMLALPAVGQDPAAETSGFRVLFEVGAETPAPNEPDSAGNKRAIASMANAILALGGQPAVRFVFVARREEICMGEAGCQADERHYQRGHHIRQLLLEEARRRGRTLPLNRIGDALTDELMPHRVVITTPKPGMAAVDMRLLVDDTRAAKPYCNARVVLHDPTLPSVIGAATGTPLLPLAEGVPVRVGSGARIGLLLQPTDGRSLHAYWSDSQGRFAKADIGLLSGTMAAAPTVRQTLHLVAVHAPAADFLTFMQRLTPDMMPLAPLPSLLAVASAGQISTRGIGDHVLVVPPSMLSPAPTGPPENEQCQWPFEPAGQISSR